MMFVQCLSDIGVDNEGDLSVPSPIIGWSADGFPDPYLDHGTIDETCQKKLWNLKVSWDKSAILQLISGMATVW